MSITAACRFADETTIIGEELTEDQLFELLHRPGLTPKLVGELVQQVGDRVMSYFNRRRANEAVVAAAGMAHLERGHLLHLVGGIFRYHNQHLAAASALLSHPLADEHLAVAVLVNQATGYGTGDALDALVGSYGFLAATAVRLVVLDRFSLVRDSTMKAAALQVVAELESAVGADPQHRFVLAAMGPTWAGTREDLLTSSAAVATAPAC